MESNFERAQASRTRVAEDRIVASRARIAERRKPAPSNHYLVIILSFLLVGSIAFAVLTHIELDAAKAQLARTIKANQIWAHPYGAPDKPVRVTIVED